MPAKAAQDRPAAVHRLRPGLDRGTGTDPQLDALRAAGCATMLEEHASGADHSRPVLAAPVT